MLPAGESVRREEAFAWSADLRSEAEGTKGWEASSGDTERAVTEAAGWAL